MSLLTVKELKQLPQEDINEIYRNFQQTMEIRKLARTLKIPFWFGGYFIFD